MRCNNAIQIRRCKIPYVGRLSRSAIKLINKISNKLGLNINKDFINKSIPYLELRHLLVHNDGELTEEFKKYAEENAEKS